MGLRSVGKIKDTTVVDIKDPRNGGPLVNGDKTPMTITIHGPYSARYKTVKRVAEREIAEAARGMDDAAIADVIEKRSRETLIDCIEGWAITLDSDPKAKQEPFSREHAVAVFNEFPWLAEQVDRAFSKVANFLEVRPAD
jgi:hypothetical protein